MKLLIVEDEDKTGEYLKQGLSEAGFVVDLSNNGLDGHHLAMTGHYDLLILDVMLPDMEDQPCFKINYLTNFNNIRSLSPIARYCSRCWSPRRSVGSSVHTPLG